MENNLLNKLNNLLAASNLDLPRCRSRVERSGQNQQWLLKNLKRNPHCDKTIIELLSLPMPHLLKEI